MILRKGSQAELLETVLNLAVVADQTGAMVLSGRTVSAARHAERLRDALVELHGILRMLLARDNDQSQEPDVVQLREDFESAAEATSLLERVSTKGTENGNS